MTGVRDAERVRCPGSAAVIQEGERLLRWRHGQRQRQHGRLSPTEIGVGALDGGGEDGRSDVPSRALMGRPGLGWPSRRPCSHFLPHRLGHDDAPVELPEQVRVDDMGKHQAAGVRDDHAIGRFGHRGRLSSALRFRRVDGRPASAFSTPRLGAQETFPTMTPISPSARMAAMDIILPGSQTPPEVGCPTAAEPLAGRG